MPFKDSNPFDLNVIVAGIEAAISLYEEAVEVGFFTNFTQADLARSVSPYLYAKY